MANDEDDDVAMTDSSSNSSGSNTESGSGDEFEGPPKYGMFSTNEQGPLPVIFMLDSGKELRHYLDELSDQFDDRVRGNFDGAKFSIVLQTPSSCLSPKKFPIGEHFSRLFFCGSSILFCELRHGFQRTFGVQESERRK